MSDIKVSEEIATKKSTENKVSFNYTQKLISSTE